MRRGRGEGSISQRADGRWQASVQIDGKRVYFYGTQPEVRAKLRDALDRRSKGLSIGRSSRFGAYLDNWYANRKSSLRYGSQTAYSAAIKRVQADAIGALPLQNLRHDQIQSFLNRLKYAPATIELTKRVMKAALNDAVRSGLISVNPALLAKSPTRRRPAMRVMNASQAHVFLEFIEGHPYEAFYRVMLATGMRVGELQALTWENVNLDAGRIEVVASLTIIPGEGAKRLLPKTNKTRSVTLPDSLAEFMRRHNVTAKRRSLRAGIPWSDQSYVFTSQTGSYVRKNRVGQCFKTILRRLGLPDMRLYDLRHTAATLLLANGVHPKVVSEMLGHSSVAITLDTYSHVSMTMQEQAAAVMEGILS